jgi:glycerol-3-phosphate dehydrogenase (NAD(P)+)
VSSSTSIAVLGAGTWGITLASLLAAKGHVVTAWDIADAVVAQLERDRSPTRLPHLKLPDSLTVTGDLHAALAGARTALIVAPSHAVRGLCKMLAEERLLTEGAELVLASKGIEEETLALMTEVVEQELGAEVHRRTAVLSGPSHAEEVSKGVPTAVVAAAEDRDLARRVQELFMTDRFRVYTQSDVIGVELAASLKNVIAIAAGACVGLGFGDNTLAALIARGLAEIARLGKRLGAQTETFMGLAGIGDLIVTAMSDHSRNRRFGRLIAQGRSAEEAQEEIGMVVEGVRTSHAALALGRREEIYVPITEAVVAVIDGDLPARRAVDALMIRDPKPEIYLTLDDLR